MARVDGGGAAVGVFTFLEDAGAAVQKVEIVKSRRFSNTAMTNDYQADV